jgi:deoxyribodipyrimidine photo-lyase
MQDLSVFLFRRDLRLADNSGLIAAMQASKQVIPVFIVDPGLVASWSNANVRLSFLASALKNLDQAIANHGGRLQVLQGDPAEVLSKLLNQHKINGVYTNRDYTPLARSRDKQLKSACESRGVVFHSYADQLLNEPEAVTKADGLPYTVFTPYFKRGKVHYVPAPIEETNFDFGKCEAAIGLEVSSLGPYLVHPADLDSLSVDKALMRIGSLGAYEETKDLPGVNGTSRLSALLRFGLCSVRQVYYSVLESHSLSHGLIRQLYWRDFYFQVGYHFPHVYKSAFRKKYDKLAWDHNPGAFHAWQQGETGFPIVDAGMRELLATGYMHNRVRMIVASFLTKNLHINWREGERHFARYLVDFDPALNNGNWQWGASTGCDAQPYFRVFNPWRQQLRFDKDCAYIKQWVPELRELNPRQIHALEKDDAGYRTKIVDLRSSGEESKRRFKALANNG